MKTKNRTDLTLTMDGETITSLELLKQVNHFREMEGNRAVLRHSDFLNVIREELQEEIAERNISFGSYLDKQNQPRPMFTLPLKYAKQVLMRE